MCLVATNWESLEQKLNLYLLFVWLKRIKKLFYRYGCIKLGCKAKLNINENHDRETIRLSDEHTCLKSTHQTPEKKGAKATLSRESTYQCCRINPEVYFYRNLLRVSWKYNLKKVFWFSFSFVNWRCEFSFPPMKEIPDCDERDKF